MNILRIAPALAAIALASGCSSLLGVKSAPFTIYSPQYAAPAQGDAGPVVDWQLIVETPLASAALDSARIVVMPQPGVIEVFPGARWSDPAPVVLRRLVVEGFESSGRIVGVGGATTGMRADYALAIDLQAFQLDVTATGAEADIALRARMLDYARNRVISSRAFSARVPAASSDAPAAFAAIQAALNEVVPEVVGWTLEQGTAARGKSLPSHPASH